MALCMDWLSHSKLWATNGLLQTDTPKKKLKNYVLNKHNPHPVPHRLRWDRIDRWLQTDTSKKN